MDAAGHKRIEVTVSGRVQGVGFRAGCQQQAIALGLTGWVRNRWNGTVEARFEGPAEAVDRMITWCWQGPSMAEVTGVEVRAAADEPPHSAFRVR